MSSDFNSSPVLPPCLRRRAAVSPLATFRIHVRTFCDKQFGDFIVNHMRIMQWRAAQRVPQARHFLFTKCHASIFFLSRSTRSGCDTESSFFSRGSFFKLYKRTDAVSQMCRLRYRVVSFPPQRSKSFQSPSMHQRYCSVSLGFPGVILCMELHTPKTILRSFRTL